MTGGLLVTDFYREKHGVPMSSLIYFIVGSNSLVKWVIYGKFNMAHCECENPSLLCFSLFFFVFLRIAGKHKTGSFTKQPLVDHIKAYHQQTVTINSNSAVEPPARASFTCENPKVSNFVPGRQRIARGLLAFYNPIYTLPETNMAP